MVQSEFVLRECLAKKNKIQLILGNGSERGDYVNCAQLQRQFSVPHQGIMLMKTYYPNSAKWTPHCRISEAHPDASIAYAWDYDYDDYHPLDIFESESQTVKQFTEVKQIGSDIHLTLTIDRSLSDEVLIEIFRSLRQYGVVYLRINHEANGAWFNHNKKSSYFEVSQFFVRCHKLIKANAPKVKTVFSLTADIFVGDQVNSLVTKKLARLGRDELGEALEIADFWSIDKYVSLNWGWPHTHPSSSDQFFCGSVDSWWRLIEETYLLMITMNGGKMKPLYLHEFNSDSDVVGFKGQADTITQVYERILNSDFPWLKGICFYQYGDYGGLGLFQQKGEGSMKTESFDAYHDVIKKMPPVIEINTSEVIDDRVNFKWESTDEMHGIQVTTRQKSLRFVNQLKETIYLVDSTGWNLMAPESSKDVLEDNFCIFVPPRISEGKIRHEFQQDCINEKMRTCII